MLQRFSLEFLSFPGKFASKLGDDTFKFQFSLLAPWIINTRSRRKDANSDLRHRLIRDQKYLSSLNEVLIFELLLCSCPCLKRQETVCHYIFVCVYLTIYYYVFIYIYLTIMLLYYILFISIYLFHSLPLTWILNLNTSRLISIRYKLRGTFQFLYARRDIFISYINCNYD